jgi:hypothetical protein
VYSVFPLENETTVEFIIPDPHSVDVNTYDVGFTAPKRDATFAADTVIAAIVSSIKTDGDPFGGIDPINRLNTEDSVLYTWFP